MSIEYLSDHHGSTHFTAVLFDAASCRWWFCWVCRFCTRILLLFLQSLGVLEHTVFSGFEVSAVQNLLQSRIIYWMESEIKILKEDLMSCTWIIAIQLVPGSLFTMTTTLGGPVLGQNTNSDSSFFDIHISSLGSCWQAGSETGWPTGSSLLKSVWWCSSNSVRHWIYRNMSIMF